jgi:hypothetical protein
VTGHLRLTWSRTFPNDPKSHWDFTARHPSDPKAFVRIYFNSRVTGRVEEWFWIAAHGMGKIGSGYAGSKNDAARAAEDALLGPG